MTEMGAERFAESKVPDLKARSSTGDGRPGGDPRGLGREDAGSPGAGGDAAAGAIIDATDATFASIIEQSNTIPVVVDLWAEWCGPCAQLGPLLETICEEHSGRFILAKVDVDANPQVAAAFKVQSIPLVVALLKGQVVPLFTGAQSEAQVRAVIGGLLSVAAKNGVTGTVGPEGVVASEPPIPPLHAEALEAIERGDLEAAMGAFGKALAENPADAEAKAGLAQVALLIRVQKIDGPAAMAKANRDSRDVKAALDAADVELASGSQKAALDRVLALVRTTAGEDREQARIRLVDYFEILGPGHPAVAPARRALASALF